MNHRALSILWLLAPLVAAQDPNPSGSPAAAERGDNGPQVTQNGNVLVLEYDFAQPQHVTDGGVDSFTIGGFERYAPPGAPVIPVKPVEILVPAGMKTAGITSVALNPEPRPDTLRLACGTTPRFKTPYGKEARPFTPTQPDPGIHSMSGFWPAEQHRLVTVQTNRGYDIAHVILFPLQYSPKTGKVRMASRMRLHVLLAAADSVRRANPTNHLRKALKRKLDNPDAIVSYDIAAAEEPPIPRKAGSPLDRLSGPYK